MARHNQYGFSKRQREIEKKRKKQEKQAKRQGKNEDGIVDDFPAGLAPGEQHPSDDSDADEP